MVLHQCAAIVGGDDPDAERVQDGLLHDALERCCPRGDPLFAELDVLLGGALFPEARVLLKETCAGLADIQFSVTGHLMRSSAARCQIDRRGVRLL